MENKTRRQLTGVIIKITSSDTIKVRVETKQPHPLYKKVIRSHKNYLAHTADSSLVKVGDVVTVEESKPFSKMKKWILVTK